MKRIARKTTPKVVGGKVQRKNRSAETPSYYNTPQDVPAIDRQRPGAGFRHVLKKRDLIDFVSIVPEWEQLSKGLDVIILAPGEYDRDGWYNPGVVAICAWERELRRVAVPSYYLEHRDIFDRLGVSCAKHGGQYVCQFTESTARAFQLLHIFLHELGHHHDRMTTRSKKDASRGESYAESYARRYESLIWQRYQKVVDLD